MSCQRCINLEAEIEEWSDEVAKLKQQLAQLKSEITPEYGTYFYHDDEIVKGSFIPNYDPKGFKYCSVSDVLHAIREVHAFAVECEQRDEEIARLQSWEPPKDWRMCANCGRKATDGPCVPESDPYQPCTFDHTYDELVKVAQRNGKLHAEAVSEIARLMGELSDSRDALMEKHIKCKSLAQEAQAAQTELKNCQDVLKFEARDQERMAVEIARLQSWEPPKDWRMCANCGRKATDGPCVPESDPYQPCTFDHTYDELVRAAQRNGKLHTEAVSEIARLVGLFKELDAVVFSSITKGIIREALSTPSPVEEPPEDKVLVDRALLEEVKTQILEALDDVKFENAYIEVPRRLNPVLEKLEAAMKGGSDET